MNINLDDRDQPRERRRPPKKNKLPVVLAAAVILLFIIIIGLFACGDKDINDNSTAGAGSTPSPISNLHGDMLHVGGIGFGYLDIPQGWHDFNDSDLTQWGDLTVIQYADADNDCVITLNYTAAPQTDAQTAASSCWAQMSNEGAEAIQGSTVTLGGLTAYQVYGYYADDDIMLVVWLFTDEAGQLHYVSAEGSLANIGNCVEYIESTYSLEQ